MKAKILVLALSATLVTLMGCAQSSGGSDPVDPPVVTYTLTYDVAGGNAITATVAEENTVVTLPVATKTGYTFLGWDTNADNVADGTSVTLTADMTVKALWSINSYTITFVVDGSYWEEVTSVTKEYGAVVTLPIPVADALKSPYVEFDGWSNNGPDHDGVADYPTTYTMGAGNVTLYSCDHDTSI